MERIYRAFYFEALLFWPRLFDDEILFHRVTLTSPSVPNESRRGRAKEDVPLRILHVGKRFPLIFFLL